MWTAVGIDDIGRQFFVGRYSPGCLAEFPWGDEPFDCIVCLCDSNVWRRAIRQLSRELAATNTDWIQVAGIHAVKLHDAIDQASVEIGRQAAVGDGMPMTSWHEEARAADEMAEVAALCMGANERIAVLVAGDDRDLGELISALRRRLG